MSPRTSPNPRAAEHFPFRLTFAERALVSSAERAGIEVRAVGWRRLLKFAKGEELAWLNGTISHRTSAIACQIAGDKAATKARLAGVGLPVCDGALVHDVDAALSVAQRLGSAVAVKPNLGAQGRGVRTGVTHEGAVAAAFRNAAGAGGVLIERHHPGCDVRVLVVNGVAVAAAERRAAETSADGVRSVRDLIRSFNGGDSRESAHRGALSTVDVHCEDLRALLTSQDLTLETVPGAGTVVRLGWGANLSRGGIAIDRTDVIPSLVSDMACQAARIVGLDIAGIDLLVPENGPPVILEVNASPGLRMHLAPSVGEPRDVASPILTYLFDATPRGIAERSQERA